MRKPRALRPGDRIALVAPASPFDLAEFDRGVAEVRALGFEPVYDDRVFARQGYVAGTPDVRAAAFLDAWRDEGIAALMAVRGGYGSVQILPLLPRDVVEHSPKLFIGYSDTTSILTYLTHYCGIVAIHGPMIEGKIARGDEGYDRTSLLACVTRPMPMGELAPASLRALREGEAEGVLAGGTLSQLVASLGTAFAFDPPDNCILFLEDVAERPYRIDRMVTQLKFAGILDRARALVWGEMPRCDEPAGVPSIQEVIADLCADFRGPVLFGFPSGHTNAPCMTLPLGVRARVTAAARDAAARLIIEEAAVTA